MPAGLRNRIRFLRHRKEGSQGERNARRGLAFGIEEPGRNGRVRFPSARLFHPRDGFTHESVLPTLRPAGPPVVICGVLALQMTVIRSKADLP